MTRILLFFLGMGLLPALVCSVHAEDSALQATIKQVEKIWDEAPHNAFTDLVRFQDAWYCVFREGQGHVSDDGALRVLKSPDGKAWQSVARMTADNADLRDAKICVTPDGRLMLCGAGALHQPADARHQSYIWYSDDGASWSDAIAIGPPDYWIWRITWHDGIAYGVGYHTNGPRAAQLFRSEDGRTFEPLGEQFDVSGFPNEATLVFLPDNSALCLLRRDGNPDDALLGKAEPPYTQWKWQSVGQYIGGPNLLRLEDGRLLAAGRLKQGPRTALWQLDPQTAELTPLAVLPSGGDTSYPGLVLHEGTLWMSYYSSHEGKTSIYLAHLKLPPSTSP